MPPLLRGAGTTSRRLAVALLGAACLLVPGHAEAAEVLRLDLAEAFRLAREQAPSLEAARQGALEARGQLTHAALPLPENPELALGTGPRFGTEEGTALDLELEVSQRLELGSQRRRRIELASARLARTQAEVAGAERRLFYQIARAYYQALVAREAVEIEEENLRLTSRLVQVTEERLTQGAGTALEVNAARIRQALARQRQLEARREHEAAVGELVPLVGLDPRVPIALSGELPGAGPLPPVDELVRRALAERPDLLAADLRAREAEAAVALADAEARAGLTAALGYAREEGSDQALVSVRLPLPVVHRNQGERQAARARSAAAAAERRQLALEVEAAIRALHRARALAAEALEIFDAGVTAAVEENQTLIETAFQAGKVGIGAVATLQQELLEVRERALQARAELAQLDLVLRFAAGLPLGPAASRDAPREGTSPVPSLAPSSEREASALPLQPTEESP